MAGLVEGESGLEPVHGRLRTRAGNCNGTITEGF